MFSAIGNVFAPKPRHAETTDTRQEIQRHDPDYERRKGKKRDDDAPFGFDEDDSALVTVSALQVFLENFLKSQMETTSNSSTPEDTPAVFTAPTNEAPAAPTGRAAMAASAYQHGAEATQSAPPRMQTGDMNANPLGLKTQDLRLIHGLLRDLKILAERRIEYLQIERSESFLQSLVDAVEKIK